MVYIKCERCGIIFNHKNINKRFCDECTKIRTKELVRKSVKKKYHNDKAYREKKKEQVRNKFIRDDSGIYTFDLRYLDTISAEQKYLDNIAVINIKKEVYE